MLFHLVLSALLRHVLEMYTFRGKYLLFTRFFHLHFSSFPSDVSIRPWLRYQLRKTRKFNFHPNVSILRSKLSEPYNNSVMLHHEYVKLMNGEFTDYCNENDFFWNPITTSTQPPMSGWTIGWTLCFSHDCSEISMTALKVNGIIWMSVETVGKLLYYHHGTGWNSYPTSGFWLLSMQCNDGIWWLVHGSYSIKRTGTKREWIYGFFSYCRETDSKQLRTALSETMKMS